MKINLLFLRQLLAGVAFAASVYALSFVFKRAYTISYDQAGINTAILLLLALSNLVPDTKFFQSKISIVVALVYTWVCAFLVVTLGVSSVNSILMHAIIAVVLFVLLRFWKLPQHDKASTTSNE